MIPVVDMRSGTGELSAAAQGTLLAPTGLASPVRQRQPCSRVPGRPHARPYTRSPQLNHLKGTPMRHAAPTARRPLSRAAEIAAGVVAYAIAGLSTCLVTLGSALTIWGLWQWLGVN